MSPSNKILSYYNELLRWVEDENSLKDLITFMQEFDSGSPDDVEPRINPQTGDEIEHPSHPDELPILPLRGLVVYPETVVPLTIGQTRSIKLVDDVVTGNEKFIGLVTSINPELELPGPNDLYRVGTIAAIHRLFRSPDGSIRVLVQGIERFMLGDFIQFEPYLKAKVLHNPEIIEEGIEVEAFARNIQEQFVHIAEMIPTIPRELIESVSGIDDPLQTVYTIANFQRMDLAEAQELLEIDSLEAKMKKLIGILARESEVLEIGQKIQNQAKSEIDKVQREYFLREQLKAIKKELSEGAEEKDEVEQLRAQVAEAGLSEEAEKQATRELNRLEGLPSASPEYGVIRTYLDWMVSLPWQKTTVDNLDIANARNVLEEDHYGLEDVKERILEFLAVRKLKLERREMQAEPQPPEDLIRKEREGVILCFVGPPGVGKTSLGRSIARALGREFIRISLGGTRDEAEIRGHRRTYIGALPGRILQFLRRIESKNPVFMLDEIDKLGRDFRGDPSSALLEVLDPEQNSEFRDNYLEVAFDLSQVMFITTANQLETIPFALLDRMEVIRIAGYTETEKVEIAKNYLIPRQIRENGLLNGEITFLNESIRTIIRSYTREAGVRDLERNIGQVCRKVATRITENKKGYRRINSGVVEKLLGRAKYHYDEEITDRTSVPGVATGLAWTPVGGDILFIEATRMPGSKGFQITGSIGDVMQESARAALSYIRANAKALGIEEDFFEKTDIHLHVPAGAQPKDGPSAGITIATALVSLLTGRSVHSDVGMTGEITLRGQVLPIGGIKEKFLAAHRAGLKKIILPAKNEPDLDDLPEDIRKSIKVYFVDTLDQVLEHALSIPEGTDPIKSENKIQESKDEDIEK